VCRLVCRGGRTGAFDFFHNFQTIFVSDFLSRKVLPRPSKEEDGKKLLSQFILIKETEVLILVFFFFWQKASSDNQ
jgi:hypothetical protein